MLSLKSDKGKQFALIHNKKTKKNEVVLHIIERDSYELVEDSDLRKTLEKYCDEITTTEPDAKEDLTTGFTLKDEYELVPVPSSFQKEGNNQRVAVAISGKAGSGKSFFTAKYVSAYHHMYPNNLIYYVSPNKIEDDPSYEKLLKKTSFKKSLIVVNVKTIVAAKESDQHRNCLFIFDDIIDVEIPAEKDVIKQDYVKEKEKTYFIKEKTRIKRKEERNKEMMEKKGFTYTAPTKEELLKRMTPMDKEDLEIKLTDAALIARLNQNRSKLIKEYIHETIHDFLKRGRKYGISVITTTHRFFDRNPTADCANDESGLVVLFPYANVSNEKLIEFLREKLCFDLKQARAVATRVFKNFEFLAINTSGKKFFFTSNHLQLL